MPLSIAHSPTINRQSTLPVNTSQVPKIKFTSTIPPSDPIDVKSVKVEGNTLLLTVGHGGGAKPHSYDLHWGGSFLESYPVQVPLSLVHNANGDAAEAYITRDLRFDLTPLKKAYQESYGASSGEMIVGVGGKGARYSF